MDRISINEFDDGYVTECVRGIYLFQSIKAMRLLFIDGRSKWIPKSIIRNLDMLDITDFESYQSFDIDKWFVDKYNLPIEF